MSEGWWRRAWKWWTKGSDTTTTSTTELDPNQDLQQPPPPSVAVAASSGSSQSHPSKRRRRRTPQEPPTDGTEPPHDEPGRWSSKNQPGPQDPEGQCTHDDSNNQADRNHVWFQSLDREAPTIQKDSYHDSARNHHPTRGGVARLVSPSSHPEEDEDGAGSTRVEKPAASSTHGNKQKKRQKQMVQRRKRIATAKQQTATKKRKSKRRILEDTSSSSEDDDDDGPRRTNRPPRKKQCRSSSHEKGIKKKKDPETPKPSSPHKATRTRTTTQKCKEDDDDDEDITSPTRRSSLRLQRMFDARRRYARRQQTLFPATPKTDSGSSSEPHGTSSSSPRATPNHRTKESNDDQMALPPKLSLQQPLRKNTSTCQPWSTISLAFAQIRFLTPRCVIVDCVATRCATARSLLLSELGVVGDRVFGGFRCPLEDFPPERPQESVLDRIDYRHFSSDTLGAGSCLPPLGGQGRRG